MVSWTTAVGLPRVRATAIAAEAVEAARKDGNGDDNDDDDDEEKMGCGRGEVEWQAAAEQSTTQPRRLKYSSRTDEGQHTSDVGTVVVGCVAAVWTILADGGRLVPQGRGARVATGAGAVGRRFARRRAQGQLMFGGDAREGHVDLHSSKVRNQNRQIDSRVRMLLSGPWSRRNGRSPTAHSYACLRAIFRRAQSSGATTGNVGC
jgi:hypothetical protein